MTLDRLSYILGKLICRIRKRHEDGHKFKPPGWNHWIQKCVICGRVREVGEPVRRKGGM